MSPGPTSPSPPVGSPVSQKSEKDLERERKEKEQEKERMDLAMRLGKGAVRGSTAATRASLGASSVKRVAFEKLYSHCILKSRA